MGRVPTPVLPYSLHGGGGGDGEKGHSSLGHKWWMGGQEGQGDALLCPRRTSYVIIGACVPEMCAGVVLGWSFFSIPVFYFSLSSDCHGGESPISAAPWAPHSPREHGPGHL